MKKDIVDELLNQWATERPKMDVSSLGVVVRIQMLAKLCQLSSTAALADHDLKPWEYDVLSALRRQGEPFALPASELANAALLTSGAMTTRIDRLADRNLVRRRPSKVDRRLVIVHLTMSGKAVVDAAIQSRLTDADEVLSNLNKIRKRELGETLRELILGIEEKTDSS